MSRPVAVLFPGQGTAPRDMRSIVVRDAPDLIDLLEQEVGEDLFERADESARRMQPAMLGCMLAGWRRLERLAREGRFDRGEVGAFAGHSLGEIAALVAAGALATDDAIRLVHLRGRLFEEAEAGPAAGAMCAIVGPDARAYVEPLLGAELFLANDNSPLQVVVSGTRDAVGAVSRGAREDGLRAVPMYMRYAAHSPWMRGVTGPLRTTLDELSFGTPSAPVWCSTTARPFADVRAELAEGVALPVQWRGLLENVYAQGARRYVDAGPGHVVAALAAKTLGDVETPTVSDLEDQTSA